MTTTNAKELQDQGIKLYQQKEYEAAARYFQQAQEAYAAEGQKDMVAEMQTNIGLVHRALGENQQALDIMILALRTFQEMGDAKRAAQVLGNMGGVYLELNDKEQAYNCYIQAADAFQEMGEKTMYANTMLAIGALQIKEGKFMAGAATYEIGLRELDHLTPTQKILKRVLGIRNRVLGMPDETAPNLNKANGSEAH